MARVTVQEARDHLDDLLRRVEQGEDIIITRSGRRLARLGPVEETESLDRLPSLKKWRADLQMEGERLSTIVRNQRDEEQYGPDTSTPAF